MMQCPCNTQKTDQTGVIYLHLVCLPCTLCMDWDWTQTLLFHKWCNTHGTHRKLTRLPEPARTNRASGHNDHRDNQLSQVLHRHLLLLLGAAEKNHHFDYSVAVMKSLCVSMPTTFGSSLNEKVDVGFWTCSAISEELTRVLTPCLNWESNPG